jgi:hypothetical protein
LADFRIGHQAALEELFGQVLALLETAGVVDLSTLLHDGTKVQTVAGKGSLHRRKTLEKRLRRARRVVKKLNQEADEGMDAKRRAAQQRGVREAVERAQAALRATEGTGSPGSTPRTGRVAGARKRTGSSKNETARRGMGTQL